MNTKCKNCEYHNYTFGCIFFQQPETCDITEIKKEVDTFEQEDKK